MDISKQIKDRLGEMGMNQSDLADTLEMKTSNLSRTLSPSRDPKVSTLVKIADAPDCDVILHPRHHAKPR